MHQSPSNLPQVKRPQHGQQENRTILVGAYGLTICSN